MNDLLQTDKITSGGSVECFGMTFPSEDARREYFLKLLAEKMKDSEFRNQEGFPQSTDEAILAMSDPPYYTACPNPWLADFVAHYSSKEKEADYKHSDPFASDVSEGRHTWLYKAHTYHTKVPPKAIEAYISHYTKPGDIILDAFCGSGMTGLAAMMAEPSRTVILGDLAPAATFITYGYNRSADAFEFLQLAESVCNKLDEELGWMYEFDQQYGGKSLASYIVWSDVFICEACQGEIEFYENAYDAESKKFRDEFQCPHCDSKNRKVSTERISTTTYDFLLKSPWTSYKQIPSLIALSSGGRRNIKRRPTNSDIDRIEAVLASKVAAGGHKLVQLMLNRTGQWGDQWRNCLHLRPITHAHQLFFPGQLRYLARLMELIDDMRPDHQQLLLFVLSSVIQKASRLMSYNADGIGRVQKGVLYISSCGQEMRLTHLLRITIKDLKRAIKEGLWQMLPNRRYKPKSGLLVTTGTASQLGLPDASVDYIFVDPPFGGNIPYSEVNFLWETLIGVFTAQNEEAVCSKIQEKDIAEYQKLMRDCFVELYRVLKPGRWMTVEFSNTKAAVWNAIQTSLQEAGFVVANVSALDKKQGSFKAVTTTVAVKQDLVISAYKPELQGITSLRADDIDKSVWEFLRSHLSFLPICKSKGEDLSFVIERDPRILFDRVVAWLIRSGCPIPMSSQEFQEGLRQRFSERDGMFFLPEQISEYERARSAALHAPQMELFVADERSAIDWLVDFLRKRPSTYQEIQPAYTRQLGAGWKKHEEKPELSALLEDNFLRFDGNGDVPNQIHSYLSTNFKDLRGLEKDDPRLKAKAKDRWYVPDPSKAKDLEQKRERSMLKEFEAYKTAPGRRLKEFRLEVLRTGFKTAWAARDYKTIIGIAQKIPEEALQEDEKLLLWYDQALTRTEADA